MTAAQVLKKLYVHNPIPIFFSIFPIIHTCSQDFFVKSYRQLFTLAKYAMD